MLHRKRKDGGTEELYVCEVCRDNPGGSAPGASPAPKKKTPKPKAAKTGDEKNLFMDALRKAIESRLGLGKEDDAPEDEAEAPESPDGAMDEPGDEFEFETEDPREPVCEVCGLSRSGLRRSQRLGCPACYEVFAHEVSLMIRDMHKGTQHAGEDVP